MKRREVVWPVAVFDDDAYGYLCAVPVALDALAEGDVDDLVAAFDSRGRALTLVADARGHVVARVARADRAGLQRAVRRFAANPSAAGVDLPSPDDGPEAWVAVVGELGAPRRRRSRGVPGPGRWVPPPRLLTSVWASALVVLLAPLEAPRGRRAAWLADWFSFWSADPRLDPHEVHSRAFAAWLRAGYPLLALTAGVLWLVDERWPGRADPRHYLTVALVALLSAALHLGRSLAVGPARAAAARVVAGWPAELVLLAASVLVSTLLVR
ncbi:hypothetical protein GC089_11375 [Cellulomonas sp. JZ18]|uniref:hypothetical protein n=1 Tax=Cellulomonas sp. JZ18 TaxID=2654191 RepID=UPI0012D3829B|nr:hypothetical protein [Cellulomonas sp. JZ18]QGQ19717.1 hypothetical protein GC089_11375 [Cellulomonas sp. JZ18]